MEGNSLLYLFLKWLVFQQVLPEPASFGNLPPFIYWIIYFFTGKPFPWGGLDVMIHPVAFAGWAGLLVTALNLLPVGQLDGGHILYALFGPRVKKLFPIIIAVTILLGLAWPGWWLWTVLLFFFGRMYDEPMDQITTLDSRRKVLGVLGLILFVLVFTPVPLIITSP
jgi:membrane-associated protease RseP (regulator of RpoE activity)